MQEAVLMFVVDLVSKLNLQSKPYRLQCLNDSGEVKVKQVVVPFSIGKYVDEVHNSFRS
jgi:hypothetical protein